LLRPELAPPIPKAERDLKTSRQLVVDVFKVVLPPIGLILAVLGSIIVGIAAPTEAASMGAAGASLIAALGRRLDWPTLGGTLRNTLNISAMIYFILIASQAFSLAFRGLGGDGLVEAMFEAVPGGTTGALIFMLVILFFLGFFLEWIEISYIVMPLFVPIFRNAGIDMVWMSILVGMTLQTTFLTPPVGWSLFFLKVVAPPSITTRHIYVGVAPFVTLQVVAVVLVFIYPDIALWLPRAIGW